MKRLALIFTLLAAPAWAVDPSEMLDDPVLEERAREISQLVRCPVCSNESIDESNAPVSEELRLIIRERLVAGDTNEEILTYLSARFGEFVLLNPSRDGANLLLWLAAPAMLLLGGAVAIAATRRKGSRVEEGLTPEDQAELDKILRS